MNTGRECGSSTIDSKSIRQGALPWRSAVLFLILLVGCAPAPPESNFKPSNTPVVVKFVEQPYVCLRFHEDKNLCDCGGLGSININHQIVPCPYHNVHFTGEYRELDLPFQPHSVPSE